MMSFHCTIGEVFLLKIVAQVGERQHSNRGLVRQGQRLPLTMHKRMLPGVCYCSNTELHHERFNRMGDVL